MATGLFIVSLVLALLLITTPFYAEAISGGEEAYESSIIEDGNSQTRDNYVVLNETFNSRGSRWSQPEGYSYYRVWVENTTNSTMTVTVSSPGGTFSKEVPANSSKTILTVRNAISGLHDIDYTTTSGEVSGTVRVRVSNNPL